MVLLWCGFAAQRMCHRAASRAALSTSYRIGRRISNHWEDLLAFITGMLGRLSTVSVEEATTGEEVSINTRIGVVGHDTYLPHVQHGKERAMSNPPVHRPGAGNRRQFGTWFPRGRRAPSRLLVLVGVLQPLKLSRHHAAPERGDRGKRSRRRATRPPSPSLRTSSDSLLSIVRRTVFRSFK